MQLKPRTVATPTALSSPASSLRPLSTAPRPSADEGLRRKFRSYRLRGPYEKPWLADAAVNKTRWNNFIVAGLIVLGFIGAGVISFFMIMPYKDLPVWPRPSSLPLSTLPARPRAEGRGG